MNEENCGCGHPLTAHGTDGLCQEWRRYPEVLDARRCGCLAPHGSAQPVSRVYRSGETFTVQWTETVDLDAP